MGDRLGFADSLNNLAIVVGRQGEYDLARALLDESLSIQRQLRERQGLSISLTNIGLLAHEQGDSAGARPYLEEALSIFIQFGDLRGGAHSLEGLAEVESALNRALVAARLWGAAGRLREKIGVPLPPYDQPRYSRAVTAARAAVGDVAFDAAWQEGRAMTPEQVVELALREPDEE